MRYFQNLQNQEIFAYDEDQFDLASSALSKGYIELTEQQALDIVMPKYTLQEIKQNKIDQITDDRNRELNSLTCQWDGDMWDARETDSTRITNVLTMLEQAQKINMPTPTTIDWRTYDDQDRTLSIPELIQLAASMFMQQQIVWAKQAQLKNQIMAATSKEEVISINW